jgi:hypothetical protein
MIDLIQSACGYSKRPKAISRVMAAFIMRSRQEIAGAAQLAGQR